MDVSDRNRLHTVPPLKKEQGGDQHKVSRVHTESRGSSVGQSLRVLWQRGLHVGDTRGGLADKWIAKFPTFEPSVA